VRETFKAAFYKKRYWDFINELCNGFDERKAQNMGVPDAFVGHVKSCQHLVEFEQGGSARAAYGKALLEQVSASPFATRRRRNSPPSMFRRANSSATGSSWNFSDCPAPASCWNQNWKTPSSTTSRPSFSSWARDSSSLPAGIASAPGGNGVSPVLLTIHM